MFSHIIVVVALSTTTSSPLEDLSVASHKKRDIRKHLVRTVPIEPSGEVDVSHREHHESNRGHMNSMLIRSDAKVSLVEKWFGSSVDDEGTKTEDEVLQGKPEVCADAIVNETCQSIANESANGSIDESADESLTEVTVRQLAKILWIAEGSLKNFLSVVKLDQTSRVACKVLCNAAVGALPGGARPPKSYVAATLSKPNQKPVWNIDTGPEMLQKIAYEGLRNEPVLGPNTEEPKNTTMKSTQAIPLTKDSTAVAVAISELFGLSPWMGNNTGALFDMGTEGPCVLYAKGLLGFGIYPYSIPFSCYVNNESYGYDVDENVQKAARCFKPGNYPVDMQVLNVLMRHYLMLYKKRKFQLVPMLWLRKIFNVLPNDETFSEKLGALDESLHDTTDVCIDNFANDKPGKGNLNAYINSRRRNTPTLSYTTKGLKRSMSYKVQIWIREASHFDSGLNTSDIAYDKEEVLKLSTSDAYNNAESWGDLFENALGN